MLTFETAAIQGVAGIIDKLTVCATHWPFVILTNLTD